jgi:hypothetical protein
MDNLFLILFLISLVSLIVGLIKPSLLSRFLKEKSTRKNSAIIFGVATLIFFILFGITTESTPTKNTQNDVGNQKQEQKVNNKREVAQISPVNYEIVGTEDQSHKALGNRALSSYTTQKISNLPTDKKMAYRIVVSPEIKENQVKPTVEKIISNITSKDNDIDEISLFLYSDKELVNGMYDIATATWAPEGELGNITAEIAKNNNRSNYKITIKVKENLEEYLRKRGESEDKFGLSEEERRQFFKEIVVAENRAMNEAEAKYPLSRPGITMDDIKKNADLNDELTEKYEAQVRLKYGITEDIENKIVVEAFVEGWPME